MTNMRQLIEAAGGSTKTYDDYEVVAINAFMADAAAAIKKVAGGHAEKVTVEKAARTLPFLSYAGTDASDMPLDWTGVISTDKNEVVMHTEWFVPGKGNHKMRDLRLPKGVATPMHLADLFAEAFGR